MVRLTTTRGAMARAVHSARPRLAPVPRVDLAAARPAASDRYNTRQQEPPPQQQPVVGYGLSGVPTSHRAGHPQQPQRSATVRHCALLRCKPGRPAPDGRLLSAAGLPGAQAGAVQGGRGTGGGAQEAAAAPARCAPSAHALPGAAAHAV